MFANAYLQFGFTGVHRSINTQKFTCENTKQVKNTCLLVLRSRREYAYQQEQQQPCCWELEQTLHKSCLSFFFKDVIITWGVDNSSVVSLSWVSLWELLLLLLKTPGQFPALTRQLMLPGTPVPGLQSPFLASADTTYRWCTEMHMQTHGHTNFENSNLKF